jgi:hypothetical protein
MKKRIEELEKQLRTAQDRIAGLLFTIDTSASALEILAGVAWFQDAYYDGPRFLVISTAAHMRRVAQEPAQ